MSEKGPHNVFVVTFADFVHIDAHGLIEDAVSMARTIFAINQVTQRQKNSELTQACHYVAAIADDTHTIFLHPSPSVGDSFVTSVSSYQYGSQIE